MCPTCGHWTPGGYASQYCPCRCHDQTTPARGILWALVVMLPLWAFFGWLTVYCAQGCWP